MKFSSVALLSILASFAHAQPNGGTCGVEGEECLASVNPCCSAYKCIKGKPQFGEPNRCQLRADATYFPGNFGAGGTIPVTELKDKYGNIVIVSDGLDGRAVAYTGDPVLFTGKGTGGKKQSSILFHKDPDGAATFPSKRASGGFYYASNSEEKPGGVWTLEFDQFGDVIDYFPILEETLDNCGGGKTPWGTWVTCEEETGKGYCYQTDPAGLRPAQKTAVTHNGDNYESFTYDDRNGMFYGYTTNDSRTGPLVRYTPDAEAMQCCQPASPSTDRWCCLHAASPTYEFLKLIPGSVPGSGTYEWVSDELSTRNAPGSYLYYQQAEGISRIENRLYFVAKRNQELFVLDLDSNTYEMSSTVSGAFNREPDQIQFILNDSNGVVYFCEDGGFDCGVHGRDEKGQFFTILDAPGYDTESTGLDFSPDLKYMLVAFQGDPGTVWQFWRKDGYQFDGGMLGIKYHANDYADGGY